MPSIVRSVGALALGSAVVANAADILAPKECPADVPLSCEADSPPDEKCCYNDPGGLLLITQFWDTDPVNGPEDAWTLHGLWPDNCDGTYEEFCDKEREYSNITDILTEHGKEELLDSMKTFWPDYKGDDESFWEHEWNKHGTCINTIEPDCYEDYKPQEEVVAYFEKSMELYEGLNTYKFLADAGITPSDSDTHKLSDVQAALTKAHGVEVAVDCDGDELNEVWYFFHVKGNAQSGKYEPAEPAGASSSCPDSVKYLPKGDAPAPPPSSSGGSPSPTQTSSPSPTSTGGNGEFSGKGNLEVTADGSKNGCLISSGAWYSSGTCATYTASPSGSGFTLTSSAGPCAMADGTFTCDSGVKAAVFTSKDGNLAADGKAEFFADEIPSGSAQSPISTGDGGVELTVSWKSS